MSNIYPGQEAFEREIIQKKRKLRIWYEKPQAPQFCQSEQCKVRVIKKQKQ